MGGKIGSFSFSFSFSQNCDRDRGERENENDYEERERFSDEVDGRDEHIDRLDADERHDDAAEAVDQEIAAQHRGSTDRAISDAAQRERIRTERADGPSPMMRSSARSSIAG